MTTSAEVCWRCIEALRPVGPLEALPDSGGAAEMTLQLFSMWEFGSHGPLQNIVHAMKYGRQPWLAGQLGKALADHLLNTTDYQPDAVVPIPLHRVRFLERGYNQALEIARPVAAAYNVGCLPDTLMRRRPTHTQTTLSRDQRLANVKDAFVVSGTAIPNRILLIDDVATTGATLEAAAAALKSAGVATVTAATVGISKS